MRPSTSGFLARMTRRLGWKMAWNEPGNGKDDKDKKDPWSGQNQEGPPDLDEVVKKMQAKFGGIFGKKGGGGNGGGRGSGGSSSFGFYALVFGVLAILWIAYDATYTVQQAERGVVLRFGRYVDTIQPGLNIRFPRPIERVYKIDVENVDNFTIKASMLTQDENIVDAEFFVQYKICVIDKPCEPEKFLFNIRWVNKSADQILRSIMESAVRDMIGKNKMDFIMTEGRNAIARDTLTLMQGILSKFNTGVYITELKLQSAKPPQEVQAAFSDAIKAREDEIRSKNEAEAYRNDITPKARGKSARDIADATAYKAQVIDEAKGNASRFEQLLAEYQKAPKVTRDRLYLETVESVLANNRKVMIDVDSSNNLMYLPLDRLMNQAAGAVAAQPTIRIETPVSKRRDSIPFRSDSREGVRR